MGESRGIEQEALSPIEYLDELCAYAMSIGMSYELYWNGDTFAINHFIKAEKIRQRKRNTEMWLQGAYIYNAVGALVPVINPFSKEHKARPYLKKPIPISLEEQKEQEQQEELDKYNRFVDYMMKRVEASKK